MHRERFLVSKKLNAQGIRLLQEGKYEAAIDLWQEARFLLSSAAPEEIRFDHHHVCPEKEALWNEPADKARVMFSIECGREESTDGYLTCFSQALHLTDAYWTETGSLPYIWMLSGVLAFNIGLGLQTLASKESQGRDRHLRESKMNYRHAYQLFVAPASFSQCPDDLRAVQLGLAACITNLACISSILHENRIADELLEELTKIVEGCSPYGLAPIQQPLSVCEWVFFFGNAMIFRRLHQLPAAAA